MESSIALGQGACLVTVWDLWSFIHELIREGLAASNLPPDLDGIFGHWTGYRFLRIESCPTTVMFFSFPKAFKWLAMIDRLSWIELCCRPSHFDSLKETCLVFVTEMLGSISLGLGHGLSKKRAGSNYETRVLIILIAKLALSWLARPPWGRDRGGAKRSSIGEEAKYWAHGCT